MHDRANFMTNLPKHYIKIENDGEIELAGLHMMGVTDKRDDDDKIGFFGSGNKYALAVLLREGVDVTIYSGKKRVEIDKKPLNFRESGKLFEQILIDGKETSLTTSMGPNWEQWFAVREFYCNARDEGGEELAVADRRCGKKGKTRVFIERTEELSKFFRNIKDYMLISKKERLSKTTDYTDSYEIYPNKTKGLKCYRKGIRITPKNETKAIFKYNFNQIDINESRTYKYEWEMKQKIAEALTKTPNEEVVRKFLKEWKGKYEENLPWEDVSLFLCKNSWQKILRGKRVYPRSHAEMTPDDGTKYPNSVIVPDKLALKINDELNDVFVEGVSTDKPYKEFKLGIERKELLEKAIGNLSSIGMYIIKSKIITANSTTGDEYGWYDGKMDKIFLTEEAFISLETLEAVLYEEQLHEEGFNHGNKLRDYLIKELIKSKKKNSRN